MPFSTKTVTITHLIGFHILQKLSRNKEREADLMAIKILKTNQGARFFFTNQLKSLGKIDYNSRKENPKSDLKTPYLTRGILRSLRDKTYADSHPPLHERLAYCSKAKV